LRSREQNCPNLSGALAELLQNCPYAYFGGKNPDSSGCFPGSCGLD
jgi:hypothetical protein